MIEAGKDDLGLNPPDPEHSPSKLLPVFGILITLLWLGALITYVVATWSSFSRLAANELADFAGGAFAPLAFLWLVLGFFQQGKELRLNGQALWLQGRELQYSVEQQRQLVEVTREQLNFENDVLKAQREDIARNSQPVLALQPSGSFPGGNNTRMYGFSLVNRGRPCTDVVLHFFRETRSTRSRDLLGTGDRWDFNSEFPVTGVEQFEALVSYLDERLTRGEKKFQVSRNNAVFDISE